jgi:hypothetical protein
MSKWVFKEEGREWDLDDWAFIGYYLNEPKTFFVSVKRKDINTAEDLMKAKGIKLATIAEVGGPPLANCLALELLGLTDGKVISGYDSTPEMGLAAGRGEVDGFVIAAGSGNEEVNKGYVKPILTVDIRRAGAYPDLAAIGEVVELTDTQEAMLTLYASAFSGAKGLQTQAAVPKERVDYLREVFAKLMEHDGVQKQTISRAGAWDEPLLAKDIDDIVALVKSAPAEVISGLDTLLETYMAK